MFNRLTVVLTVLVTFTLSTILVFHQKQSHAETISIQTERPYSVFYRAEKPVKFNNDDLMCLARNIFFEAATESVIGKYAVAQVTVNRVEHSKFPTTICKVVYEPYQFSWTLDKKLLKRQPKGPRWDESLHVAFKVLYGNIRLSLVDDALFYHATYVNPRWARHKHFIARIETHIFYKYREV